MKLLFAAAAIASVASSERLRRPRGGRDARLMAEARSEVEVNMTLPCPELAMLPTYVLNLDRRKDRLALVTSTLQSRVPWMLPQTCRMRAIDGRSLGEHLQSDLVEDQEWQEARQRTAARLRTVGEHLTTGAVALIMSHAKAWELLRQAPPPGEWGLVMEDDIHYIHPGLGDALCSVIRAGAAAPWDYVQLQTNGETVDEARPIRLQPGTNYNTGMYLIRRRAAIQAESSYLPVRHGIKQLDDPRMFLRAGLVGAHATPLAAGQGTLGSDVQIHLAELEDVEHKAQAIKDCQLPAAKMARPHLMHPEK